MKKPIPFFATRSDLLDLLEPIEKSFKLKYTESGIFDEPMHSEYQCASEIEHLGISLCGNHIQERTLLISSVETQLKLREIPQKHGGVRYSLDQKTNKGTLGIKPGGLFDDTFIIAGQLGVETDDPESKKIANEIKSRMNKRFKKIKSYYVGKQAEELLDNGVRLTVNHKAAKEYDLVK